MLRRTNLTDFQWSDEERRLTGTTKIPTNIHLDLLAGNHIPDPFIGTNEKNVQWVDSRNWVYTTQFTAAPEVTGCHSALLFEGLDTFAKVELNGVQICESDNMFVPHHIELAPGLLKNENNLKITFQSAMKVANSIYKERGHLVCWNGQYERVYARKAQYHFGWDWGPSLVTAGPWKPIYLETYQSRLENVRVEARLSEDLKDGKLFVNCSIRHDSDSYTLESTVVDPEGVTLFSKSVEKEQDTIIPITDVQVWYPFTHGKQPLYEVRTALRNRGDNSILHTVSHSVGFRRVELVQSPLKYGSTFYFKVNEIPIFMGGSNWIPGDNFLTRMTQDRYARWIDLAVCGNQNMIRVWGGGIYEDDAFFDECDRRGLLVWQDFAFACGQYPSDEKFVNSVKKEAVAAIQRLRNHPSLCILAGNNEDYQVANEGLKHDMKTPKSEWKNTTFGARYTYEVILPDIVRQHAPWITYWPGSPFGGEDNNSDRTTGDVHIWNVSSGMLVPYQRYPDLCARFISEFGMLSCPHLETVKQAFFDPADTDIHPQSLAFEHHCKASSYEKRMFTCMGENFRLSFDLQRYIYLSQLTQSEAMGYAFRGWRRQFQGGLCGGALVWQTNDSWPVSSWAIIDYYERPKPAYYVIMRALKSLAIGVFRRPKIEVRPNFQHLALINGKMKADAAGVIAHATPHIYPLKESTFSVWIVNSGMEVVRGTVELRYISIVTGLDVCPAKTWSVDILALGTTEIVADKETPEEEPTVLAARLFDESGKCVVSRESDWPQPFKHYTFPDRGLTVKVVGEVVHISVKKPVKGLVLLNDDVKWSDNCLDIIPGDPQTVEAKGLNGDVELIYYGQEDS